MVKLFYDISEVYWEIHGKRTLTQISQIHSPIHKDRMIYNVSLAYESFPL